MGKRPLVRAVESTAVAEKRGWFVRLIPLFHVPSNPSSSSKHVWLPEPFERNEKFGFVYGWTEHALTKMEKFGIGFPSGLVGPVMLPSERDLQVKVPVWITADSTPGGELRLVQSLIGVAKDVVRNGESEQLSADDRAFLVQSDRPAVRKFFWDDNEGYYAYRVLTEGPNARGLKLIGG